MDLLVVAMPVSKPYFLLAARLASNRKVNLRKGTCQWPRKRQCRGNTTAPWWMKATRRTSRARWGTIRGQSGETSECHHLSIRGYGPRPTEGTSHGHGARRTAEEMIFWGCGGWEIRGDGFAELRRCFPGPRIGNARFVWLCRVWFRDSAWGCGVFGEVQASLLDSHRSLWVGMGKVDALSGWIRGFGWSFLMAVHLDE